MPRKDIYHDAVRVALENEGWTITDDPLTVPTPGLDFHIDLGAVREIIGAEKDGIQVAIEIKSLKGNSVFYDFHQALGQFMIYRLALKMTEQNHVLYLGVPESQYLRLERVEIYRLAWLEFEIGLLIFNEKDKTIVKWINNKNIKKQ